MSQLVIRRSAMTTVTPESAGWSYVGFEVCALRGGEVVERPMHGRELGVVLLSGTADVGRWRDVGSRTSVFEGTPDPMYFAAGQECAHWSEE